MNDQIVPRPDVASQRNSSERHRGHIGRGGIRRSPQLLHVCTSSSPRAQPAQNSAASGSSTSGSRKSASTVYLRSRSALVGTPSPLVTRHASAPSTWLVDVPRIWRTPSSTRLKPCTYASDIPPPDVLVGSRPSGHSSAPSSVKAAPSPRSQKPYPSSDSGMSGLNAS